MNPASLMALLMGQEENFNLASQPGGIEAQEAAGQKAICNTTNQEVQLIPKEGGVKWCQDNGFEIVNLNPRDSLFIEVKLPAGWKINPTSHSMWNNIVDETGKLRATFFYKAAFYDRSAFLSPVRDNESTRGEIE